MAKRNLFIDILKAVLIILVVIGHCIQFGSGKGYLNSTSFFNNKLFIFIYSFHMPAFMIISGYLFGLSKKTNAINVIKNKINHLLIPIFTWAILTTIIFAIKEETFNFLTIIKNIYIQAYIVYGFYGQYFIVPLYQLLLKYTLIIIFIYIFC